MTTHTHQNHPYEAHQGLHPLIYRSIIGFTLWLVLSIWVFFSTGGYNGLTLAMITLFFTDHPVRNWSEARRSDVARFGAFFRSLLRDGVYWVPSQFEAAFLSVAHGQGEIDRTVEAARRALRAI